MPRGATLDGRCYRTQNVIGIGQLFPCLVGDWAYHRCKICSQRSLEFWRSSTRFAKFVTSVGLVAAFSSSDLAGQIEAAPGEGSITDQCLKDLRSFDDKLARVGFSESFRLEATVHPSLDVATAAAWRALGHPARKCMHCAMRRMSMLSGTASNHVKWSWPQCEKLSRSTNWLSERTKNAQQCRQRGEERIL